MNKLAYLFSGQGSQYIGMGKQLTENYPLANQIFEEASDALHFDVKRLCFDSTIQELTKTENAQPALLTCSFAAFKVFTEKWGRIPDVLAGHSLGEISALTCSGLFSFSDAVRLVHSRGLFINESVKGIKGGMIAVMGVDKRIIDLECKELSERRNLVACISNYNSENEIIVSGHIEAVNELAQILSLKNGNVIPLKVSGPFHSPLMQTAAELFKKELLNINFGKLSIPVISNVTGEYYSDQSNVSELLSNHLLKPVLWLDTMKLIERAGVTTAIEFGAKQTLKNLLKKSIPSIKSYSVDLVEDLELLSRMFYNDSHIVSQDVVNKESGLKFISKCLTSAVCIKNYSKDNSIYEEGVIKPYRNTLRVFQELEQGKNELTIEHLQSSLNMLVSVLSTKGCPVSEVNECIDELFAFTEITKGSFNLSIN